MLGYRIRKADGTVWIALHHRDSLLSHANIDNRLFLSALHHRDNRITAGEALPSFTTQDRYQSVDRTNTLMFDNTAGTRLGSLSN
ncbi:hypothetical protein NU195Hw_g8154t1 [Hortaea werneckii]